MRAWVAAALLVPVFSACLGTDEACVMPHVTAGSSFAFEASGQFDFLSVGPGFVDGHFLGGEVGSRSYLDLPAGSSLALRVAANERPHIRLDGQLVPAVQATWWASLPNGSSLAFADEWVSMEDGALIALTDRQTITMPDGRKGHGTSFTSINHWSLLSSSYLSGRKLVEGRTWTEPLSSPILPREAFEDGSVSLTVHEADGSGSGCTAKLTLTFDRPWYPGWVRSFDIQVSGSTPLPVAVSETTPAAISPLRMRLTDFQSGTGRELPAWQQMPLIAPTEYPSTLEREGTGRGAPTDDGTTFPTSLHDAVAAMRASETAGPWLQSHPEATVARISHIMGHETSDVVDAWSITWTSGSGPGRNILAEWLRPALPLPGLEGSWRVYDGGPEEDATGHRMDELVPIAELARLHIAFYGTLPETLDCGFDDGLCLIGTHASTDRAKAWGPGAGPFIWPGVQVDVVKGWIVVDASLDHAAVPPPVT